ncbi:hypothetical protein ACFRCW_33130 [Streptomyces sp. NPDC056653]|uniref:hypothetical protein n=1 Tax=unclassified Streptomyces TaxID=2593676 RepID=UPI0033AB27E1
MTTERQAAVRWSRCFNTLPRSSSLVSSATFFCSKRSRAASFSAERYEAAADAAALREQLRHVY